MKFKKVAGKITKGANISTNVLKVATPLYKYRKEIATGAKYAAKGAKFLYNHQDQILAASRYASKLGGGGSMSIPGALVDATLGIAMRKGEKYLDKKLDKYKAYRIARAGVNTIYDVGTGNPMAALKEGTKLYAEIDPNKKRAAKVSGVVNGATGLASGLMRGDALGAYQGASQLYSTVDPNKKRVEKFNNIKSNYLDPTVGLGAASYSLANQTSKSNKSLNEKKFIV
jgi:hypothetical protein